MARRRNWGTGSVVAPTAPGAAWSIRWQEAGRRRFKSGFPSRELAQRALDGIRGDLARDRAGLPPDARRLPTLAALAKDWLARREHTHRSWRTDRDRWKRDLEPTFGLLRAAEVTQAGIRAWAEGARRRGLAAGSVGLGLRLLSTFWTDLAERPRETGAVNDPTKRLPRSLRKMGKSTHDPRTTPFVRQLDDVGRIYLAMSGAPALAYAVGALTGLRTGELIGLAWADVDLERRQILVQRQVSRGQLGPLKDEEPRAVPIPDALLPVLRAARLEAGGRGQLCPPARLGRRSGPQLVPARFVRPQSLSAALRSALVACGLADLTWYQATRHTYASQYVLAGGSLTHLQALLGHSSPQVTQRYAHLAPQDLAVADVSRLDVDLGQRTGRMTRHPTAGRSVKRSNFK